MPSGCPTSQGTGGAMGDFHTEQSALVISTTGGTPRTKKRGKKGTGTLGKSSEGAEERGAGRAGQLLRQFDAHPRALVDDHDAVGVAQVHDLLSVRVVAGAERVGPQPAQQVEILHNQGPVQAFATDLGGERDHPV